MGKGVPLEQWQQTRDREVEGRVALRRGLKPLTAKHKLYQQAILDHKVVICVGNAGTGKTTLACGVAAQLLRENKVEQVVLARPLVECDEELGTLPGGIDEKTELFITPLMVGLREAMSKEEFEKARREGRLVVVPLGQMRGRTFHNAIVIIDEAENASYRQLRMALTRIGENCRMVVNGDTTQSDLKGACPLIKVWNALSAKPTSDEVAFVRMGPADCLRPALVQFIDQRLEACISTPTLSISTTAGLSEELQATEPPSCVAPAATPAQRSGSSSRYSRRLGS